MDSRVNAVIAAEGWYIRYWDKPFWLENWYELQVWLISNNLTNFERKPRNFEGIIIIWVVGDKKVGGGVIADQFRLLS